MTIGRRPRGLGISRTAALVPALCLALAACSAGASSNSTGGGPVDKSATAFTPAATPTMADAGAYDKPSTGGVRLAPTGSGLLDGKVITIDPGHSGKFDTDLLYHHTINYYGTGYRPCQNAGSTAMDKKTTEADLTWDVASRVVTVLRSRGATVLLTRPDNEGYGPCNDERAKIANRAHADLLISIHADGNENATNRGFFVIHSEKMKGGDAVVAASTAAAKTLVQAVTQHSSIPVSNYVGGKDGTMVRSNELGVLNTMETGPAVLIEMGNIISPADWSVLSTPEGLQAFAEGVAAGAGNIVLTPAGSATASASATPSTTK